MLENVIEVISLNKLEHRKAAIKLKNRDLYQVGYHSFIAASLQVCFTTLTTLYFLTGNINPSECSSLLQFSKNSRRKMRAFPLLLFLSLFLFLAEPATSCLKGGTVVVEGKVGRNIEQSFQISTFPRLLIN